MKGNPMKYCMLGIVCTVLFSAVSAQEYPFPQNIKYPYGYMPATFSTEKLENWYDRFKKDNKLQNCNGGIAPMTDNGTKVEAMGWIMIIAAYMGDKDLFDGLYTFYKSKIQSHGMMAWLTSCGGVSDAGSASDGDLDVAFAMVVASWQWGESYRKEAIDLITTVKKLITDCNGTSVVVGGYGSDGRNPYGGCSKTDISYYTPAFFREFAKLTDDDDWERLADDTYIVLNNGANDRTGLVPDWQTWDGQPQGSYKFDACRVPWRMALDYLWNGNEDAKEWCTTISGWAYGVGPKNIKDGYNLDGSASGSWHSMSFVGGFAVAAMCHSQEVSDAFGEEVARMSYDSYWYHSFLGNCYMLTMSGNMWRPDLEKAAGGIRSSVRTPPRSIFIKKSAHRRELVVSGTEAGYAVHLSTLDGKMVCRRRSGNGTTVSVDISSVKKGCYLLSVRNRKGIRQERRVVTLF